MNMPKSINMQTILMIAMLLIICALCLFPEVAVAAVNPIKKGADSFLGMLTPALAPIATIIIIFGALGAWRNLWGWDKFWWAMVIVFLVFFAPKLVTLIKSWAG